MSTKYFIRIGLVALVLFLVLAAYGSEAARRRRRRPPPIKPIRSSSVDFFYRVGTDTFNCAHNVSVNAIFTKCSDGSAPKFGPSVRLDNPTKVKNWVRLCGGACVDRNVEAPDATKVCVGAVRRTAKQCALALCPANTTILSASQFKGNVKLPPSTAELASTCFEPLPTNSPTTGHPTPRPTKPTGAPVPPCEVEGLYGPEFRTLEGFDVQMDLYTQVQPDKNLCEYVRPRNMLPSGIEQISSFQCSLAACIRWCTYASLCTFAMYSPVEQLCYRANNLELTDSPDNFKPYFENQWVVYRKNTINGIRYFSGKCNEYLPKDCNRDPECRWNKGKQGYNDVLQGGGAGGWCGRTKCLAAGKKSG